jgi:ABC-type antimicrobial peptide transport system permease subunit
VALVNQTFARRMFGKGPAVGRHFLDASKTLYTVKGVVEDGKYDSLTEPARGAMFFPSGQQNQGDTTLIVRSRVPAGELAPALRQVLARVDASLPFTFQAWPDALALVMFPARIATAALSVMGMLAALLAVTGVFGMASYAVSKRMRELGLRVALGAGRWQVMRSALGRPLVVLLAGSAAGLAGGVVAGRLLAYVVYEATPSDPVVLLGALLTMVLIGLGATALPARRALGVDPATLLRTE